PKTAARQQTLAKLKSIPVTLIFYEAPTRLVETLADMHAVLGNRNAAVARELTKTYEDVRRGELSELQTHYDANAPKGEIVIVVEGAGAEVVAEADVDALLRTALKTHGSKQAAQLVAAETGRSVRDVYARALEMKNEKPHRR